MLSLENVSSIDTSLHSFFNRISYQGMHPPNKN